MPKFIIYQNVMKKGLSESEQSEVIQACVEEILEKGPTAFTEKYDSSELSKIKIDQVDRGPYSPFTLIAQINDEETAFEEIRLLKPKHKTYLECTLDVDEEPLWKSTTKKRYFINVTLVSAHKIDSGSFVLNVIKAHPDTRLIIHSINMSDTTKPQFCVIECDCTDSESISKIRDFIKNNLDKESSFQEFILMPIRQNPAPPATVVISEKEIYNLSKELGDSSHCVRYDSSFPMFKYGEMITRKQQYSSYPDKKADEKDYLKIKDTIESLILELSDEVKKSRESVIYRFFNDLRGTKVAKLAALKGLNTANNLEELKEKAEKYKAYDQVMYGRNSRTAKIISTIDKAEKDLTKSKAY